MCVDKCGTANVGTIESEEAFIAVASARVYRHTGCLELTGQSAFGHRSAPLLHYIGKELSYGGAVSPEEWIVASASNVSNKLKFTSSRKQKITYSTFRFAIQPIHARQSINTQWNASRANGNGSRFEGYLGTWIWSTSEFRG